MAPTGSGKGRLIYADDFNDPKSGWPNESTRPMRDGRIYQRAYIGGLYRIDVKFEGWIYTAPKRQPPGEFTCEFRGRVFGDRSEAVGQLILNVGYPTQGRFFRVRIHHNGNVSMAQKEKENDEMVSLDELRPGNVNTGPTSLNTLVLHAGKQTMDIFVNGRRVGETLAIPWEEKPSSVSIGVSCQARNMCGELDRFEIRELDKFASDNSKSGSTASPAR